MTIHCAKERKRAGNTLEEGDIKREGTGNPHRAACGTTALRSRMDLLTRVFEGGRRTNPEELIGAPRNAAYVSQWRFRQ